ncbi:hypothetical protein FISHEDRAFT_49049 [Fistulina hepatica ATCC 64428]|uniref:Uncharacterized protein n=1 Tax=Fistulina hepatica ATCC 64428 TaxID=1128425 RepID=A0A0D7A3G6_9AGAR|nr:hypothetical protein FISHEDRAFT_49049 [Fistulina hepatica ATCC 64428]
MEPDTVSRPLLPVGHICVGLFSRGDGKFHWSILLPFSTTHTYVYHATNLYGGGWIHELQVRNVHDWLTTCAVIRLSGPTGLTSPETLNDLLNIKYISMDTPTTDPPEPFTCRVWVRKAIRVLHGSGYINCPNAIALEDELRAFGEAQDPATITGCGYSLVDASIAPRA